MIIFTRHQIQLNRMKQPRPTLPINMPTLTIRRILHSKSVFKPHVTDHHITPTFIGTKLPSNPPKLNSPLTPSPPSAPNPH